MWKIKIVVIIFVLIVAAIYVDFCPRTIYRPQLTNHSSHLTHLYPDIRTKCQLLLSRNLSFLSISSHISKMKTFSLKERQSPAAVPKS